MRKYLLIYCLFVSLSIFAQNVEKPQRSPEDIAQRQTAMLKQDLDLTDEQVEQVYVINLKYAQLGRPQNQEQADERIKQKLSDLKAILTEQQYESFLRKMTAMKRMPQGRRIESQRVETEKRFEAHDSVSIK